MCGNASCHCATHCHCLQVPIHHGGQLMEIMREFLAPRCVHTARLNSRLSGTEAALRMRDYPPESRKYPTIIPKAVSYLINSVRSSNYFCLFYYLLYIIIKIEMSGLCPLFIRGGRCSADSAALYTEAAGPGHPQPLIPRPGRAALCRCTYLYPEAGPGRPLQLYRGLMYTPVLSRGQ